MEKREWTIKFIVMILLLMFLAGLFFYTKKCEDMSCFNSYLEKCNKARFIEDTKDSIWSYSIAGASDNKCKINVELLVVKEGSSDLKGLENQNMECYLNIRDVKDPKGDLSKCHGELREGIQDIMIQKLHAYILKNIGKISEELTKIT